MNQKQEKKYSKNKTISEHDIKQYIIERFADIKKSKKIKDLINFQTMNKYMMMAHDQEELKILGNVVANHKKKPVSEILEEYETHLKSGLENKPTMKKHANVIMHIFGYFSKDFNQYEKEKFLHILKEFREGKIQLGDILAEIYLMVFRFNNRYLANQTYFLLYSKSQSETLFHSMNIKI